MKLTPQSFSDATGVSVDLAKKIIDMLDEQKLEPQDLNSVLWRLREMVIKRDLGKLMDSLDDEEIKGVINQMVAERAMYDCPAQVCAAKNLEDLARAFNSLGKPESAWFFSQVEDKKDGGYKKGDIVTIQIFRVGKWEHPDYGTVEVTEDTIKDVVTNFKENKRGVELCVDENHESDHKALGWYKQVYSAEEGKACFAKIELTKKGADLLNDGAYKYFSPEICFSKLDEESGELLSNLLIGGAFTNRPFFKGMQPLMASEGAATAGQRGANASNNPYFFTHNTMHKLLLLMDKVLSESKFTASEKAELETRYNEVAEKDRTEDLNQKFAELIAKFEEEAPATTETPAETPEVETPAEGEEKPEGEGEEPKPEGDVQANEDGTFTVDASFMESVKGMQKNLSAMSRKSTLSACEASTKSMLFSDAKPTNVVTPKHVPKITAFAADLSEAKRKVFFEIIGSLKAVPAGVKGHGKDPAKMDFNDPKSIPENDEKVQYFMEKLHQPLETAQKSAAHYYAEQASKR